MWAHAMRASPLICDYREPNQSVWCKLAKQNHKSQRKKRCPHCVRLIYGTSVCLHWLKFGQNCSRSNRKRHRFLINVYKLLMSICQEHAVKMIQCFGSSFGCSQNERLHVNLQKLKQKAGGKTSQDELCTTWQTLPYQWLMIHITNDHCCFGLIRF